MSALARRFGYTPKFLPRPETVHFVGDSHVLPFQGLLLNDEPSELSFTTAVRSLGDFAASDVITAGALNPAISQALFELGIIATNGAARHLARDEAAQAEAFRKGVPLIDPFLIFALGGCDYGKFLAAWDPATDFKLPDGRCGIDPAKKEVPYAEVEHAVRRVLKPYFLGVRHLVYKVGLRQTFMLGLTPPGRGAGALEHKIHWTFNQVLSAFCATGLMPKFIDASDKLVDDDGCLKAEYSTDGVHLNSNAAKILLWRSIQVAITQGFWDNSGRYETVIAKAAKPAAASVAHPSFAAFHDQFQARGHFTARIDSPLVAKAASLFVADQYGSEVGPIQFDWVGRDAAAGANVDELEAKALRLRRGPISREFQEVIYKLVYETNATIALQAARNADFIVYVVRLLRTMAPATRSAPDEGWHTDGMPPGVFRAMIYLADVDEDSAPIQFRENGAVESGLGPAGSMVVFNPNREHRGTNAVSRDRLALDLTLGPRIPAIPRMVVCAGMHGWPSDPLQFSLRGSTTYPDFGVKEIGADPFAGVSNISARR